MKALDSLKRIFPAKKEYRIIAMLFLVLVAVVLILAANMNKLRLNVEDLRRLMSEPGNLATSPIAIEMLKEKQEQAPMQPAATAPQTNQEQNKEPQKEQTQKPEIAVVPAKPSTAPDATPRSDMFIVPRLEVTVPIVTPKSTDDNRKLKSLLDSGVLIYPGSVDFGELGQTVVLGHSAPAGWPDIKYDTIFSRIVELSVGDKIIAIYNDKTYNYSVVDSKIIEKGADIPNLTNSDNTLVLVTCWPPGRDLKRIIVEAALDSVE